MSEVSLQFRGVENVQLLAMLGLGIAAALLLYGLGEVFFRKERKRGLLCLGLGLAAGAVVILASFGVGMNQSLSRLFWMALVAALITVTVTIFYWAVYSYLGRRRMAILLLLRFGAILALTLVLFKPAISLQPGGSFRLTLPILIDRSASMGTVDQADMPNRYQQSAGALASHRDDIEKRFRPAIYHFAATPQAVESIDDLAELSPTGAGTDATDIAAAIRRAAGGYSADELAGIILISDGLHNTPDDVAAAARESPVPIYVLGVGAEKEVAGGRQNVRLLEIDAPLEAIRNNISTVTGKLLLTRWKDIPTKVTLTEGGKPIGTPQQISTNLETDRQTVKFAWTPGDSALVPDIRKLILAAEPNPAEATPDDNAAEFHVLVTQPGIRVLYVEGTARPEYKFLRNALATDPNVKLISLVQIADNNFLSQGKIDDKSLSRIPVTDEEFGLFDVIILGDLDRKFLTSDQMERMRKFVEGGKALLMIGGSNAFGRGGYGDTPIEAALPVVCGGRGQEMETLKFLPRLTAAGVASPVFAGIVEYFQTPTDKPAKELPELQGMVTVPKAKPGASVLAVHPSRQNADGPLVVLATQQYGAGRSAAFTAYTTYTWHMKLAALGKDSPYERFWGQLVRYLSGVENKDSQESGAVLLRLDRTFLQQGEQATITVLVKDAGGHSTGEALVSGVLKGGADKTPGETKLAIPPAKATGLYQATLKPPSSGKFKLTVTAQDKQSKTIGTDSLTVLVNEHSAETDRLARDGATLRNIAQARGGAYRELSALPEVIDEIAQRQGARLLTAPPARRYDLYNFTLLFLVFVGLLTTEWLLRRSWQLQ
jgi:uncharacterized membrane protein